MEKEQILDKMRQLRDKRDLEILKDDFDKTNLDNDYNKKLLNNKVLNVKYLGEINLDGDKKEIYLLLEQQLDKNGNTVLIEKYYTGDFEFIGGNKQGDGFDLMLDSKYMTNNQLLEDLKNIDKDGILDLNKIENERLEEIAKILGVKKEDLNKVSEISNENIKETEEKIDKEYDNKDNDKLTKNEVEKVNTKAEINTSEKITDNETIAEVLGVQYKGYEKIAIIYSDKLNEKSNTTKFVFVGINKDRLCRKD